MRKKIKYTDGPIGKTRTVKDFLPPPEELAYRDESVKITMTLGKSSVEFFKKAARKYHTPYQKMIRRLVDAYAVQHHDDLLDLDAARKAWALHSQVADKMARQYSSRRANKHP